jgi:hypothetical protein
MSWVAEKNAAIVLPPVMGSTAAVNCSTTVQVVDLCSLPQTNAIPLGDPANVTPVGHYVRITATLGDVYFQTGSNFNALNAIANTALYSTVNATTGKLTIQGNEVDCIPNTSYKDFVIPANGTAQTQSPPGASSPSRYLALLTLSGNAIARLYQSGP